MKSNRLPATDGELEPHFLNQGGAVYAGIYFSIDTG
ncbi:MAG: hypothetical protein JWQ54_4065 [Mucilaginibacter sp.]|nr:hypothetical protein [Mucilaginibacter sp.]